MGKSNAKRNKRRAKRNKPYAKKHLLDGDDDEDSMMDADQPKRGKYGWASWPTALLSRFAACTYTSRQVSVCVLS